MAWSRELRSANESHFDFGSTSRYKRVGNCEGNAKSDPGEEDAIAFETLTMLCAWLVTDEPIEDGKRRLKEASFEGSLCLVFSRVHVPWRGQR